MKSIILKTLFLFLLLCLAATSLQAQVYPYRNSTSTVADMVIEEAMKYIGIPYRWGGKSPKGFDCAGFTRYIYSKFGVQLAPSAAPQFKQGPSLKNSEIQKGDLVFYGGRGASKSIGHVGIVTSVEANGFYFIHSATSTGITVSHSSEPYYQKRYKGACRVVDLVTTKIPSNDSAVRTNVPVYRRAIFTDRFLAPRIPFAAR